MLSVYAFIENCSITIKSDNDVIDEALSTAPILINDTRIMNEGIIANIITKIKEFFSKLKMILRKIVSKLFGAFSSFTGASGFTSTEDKIIRRKIDNPYFVRKFYPYTYDWNKKYLWALSDMVMKLDSVRVKLADGSQIDTASSTIVDNIVTMVNRVDAGVTSDFPHKVMKSEYQDSIDKAVKRVLNVYDVSEIEYKIRSKEKHYRQFTKKEIYFMYEDYMKTNSYVSEIYNKYERLINCINKAESALSRIEVGNVECSDAYVQMIQDLMYLLQYKVKIINSIEHIHIEKLRERATEYERLLHIFINL